MSAITAKASRKMKKYAVLTREPRCFLGSFDFSWEQRKFEEIAVRSSVICSDDTLPRVEYEDIVSGTGRLNKDIYAKQSSKSGIVFHQGDVLYGKLRPYLQNWLLPTFDGLAVGDFWVLQPQNADSSFLYRLIQSRQFDEVANQSTGTKMPRADWKLVSKTVFSIPSNISEQAAIGTYFTALDSLITLHQRKYDKLQVLKKAMLEKMFPKNGSSVPEIRFKGFTDAWEQRKFSDITFPAGEKNKENLPLESYSITNESGFVPQDEKFENGGTMREADKRMYYIVSPNSFAYNPARINVGSIGYQDTGKSVIVSSLYEVFKTSDDVDDRLLWHWFKSPDFQKLIMQLQEGGVRLYFYYDKLCMGQVPLPSLEEQRKIGKLFDTLDHLIALHQRKPYSHIQRRCNMLNEAQSTDKFCEYYAKWITVYKKGAIRQVTMDKYLMTQKWLEKLIPDLKICDLNRIAYQQLLNDYAEYHERQTTMDFHHQLKGAVLDAVDEGLIDRDPTRKAIIKGKAPSAKKIKYLNQFELHTLLASLELKDEVNWDYFILLVAKTGMRFSEALALTPKDFDFYHQTLSISKTWDYKGAGGFQPTKNKSSVRKIQIDWQSVIRFSELVKGLPEDQPIFVDGKVYNSTVNDVLSRHCERCNIPVISIHGLRHTHASLLLFTGVSIASVARRLGHSSMTTTQKTYLHIIQELENKDIDLVMRSLSGLN